MEPADTNRSNRAAEGPQTLVGSDSPHSSAPSTPEDSSRAGNRRSEAVKIAGEDYFLPDGRIPEARSSPATPQPVVTKTLVFSPRIQFHETWPSGEYDRRGDIATCNRLTPLLAQQIKEELNNFKMVSPHRDKSIPALVPTCILTLNHRKWKFTRPRRSTLISCEALARDDIVWHVSYCTSAIVTRPPSGVAFCNWHFKPQALHVFHSSLDLCMMVERSQNVPHLCYSVFDYSPSCVSPCSAFVGVMATTTF